MPITAPDNRLPQPPHLFHLDAQMPLHAQMDAMSDRLSNKSLNLSVVN